MMGQCNLVTTHKKVFISDETGGRLASLIFLLEITISSLTMTDNVLDNKRSPLNGASI